MKNKLYSLLNFAFCLIIGLDIIAFSIYEQNPHLVFAQFFLSSCLILTLILCIPMLLVTDFSKSSEL